MSISEIATGRIDLGTTHVDDHRGHEQFDGNPLVQVEHLFKFSITGPSGVGKSSLVARLTNPNWQFQKVRVTIGTDCRQRTMQVGGHLLRLQFMDTQGVERHARMTSTFYRSAHVIFLVFDLSDLASFDEARHVLDEILTYQKSRNTIKVLVGNKLDAVREVDTSAAQAMADNFDIPYYETSAYDGENIEEMLGDVCSELDTQRSGWVTTPNSKPKKSCSSLTTSIKLQHCDTKSSSCLSC